MVINKKLILSLTSFLLSFPVITLAQPGTINQPLSVVVANLTTVVLNILWAVATTFSVIMFVVAGFMFLTARGEPDKVKDARNAVIWGTVGVVVIVLAWSIIAFVRFQFAV